jgi:hypothetical protein
MRTALYGLGGLAIIGFFVVRQRRSDRYRERSLILPLALGLYGVALLRGTWQRDRLTMASIALLGLSALASIGFGVFRGRTMNLFVRDGELWEQASWTTVGVGWSGLLLDCRRAVRSIADIDPCDDRDHSGGTDACRG